VLIVDYSQVVLSNLLAQLGTHTNTPIEVDVLRPMVLNSLRAANVRFRREYGEVVIACDAKNYWRRDFFPFYKANRKKARESIDLDWPSVFKCMDTIREELAEFFPYRVIRVEGAEADDVIGTLCRYTASQTLFEDGGQEPQPVMILSKDGDFAQLQRYAHVKQFDPIGKKLITCDNPAAYLKEHILRGDTGDGVPNFLSADNCLVMKIRQNAVTKKNVAIWMDKEPEEFCDNVQLKNYYRNKTLVDLSQTPESIQTSIIDAYKEQGGKDRSRLFNYFVTRRLRHLLEAIGDF
jgi:hypothetical protein